MKKFLTTLFFIFAAFDASAAIRDGFFFEPFLSVEYSAPRLSGNAGSRFSTESFSGQLKNFDNIAIGGHARIHKYLGLNANWAQSDLEGSELKGYSLAKKAGYVLDYYNFSTQFFAPVYGDSVLEAYLETGISDMRSKISIFENSGNYNKKSAHETLPFVGLGFQFAPFESANDAIRLTWLRYLGKVALVNSDLTMVRLGYIKSF